MSKSVLSMSVVFAAVSMFAGCAATPMVAGADEVKLVTEEPDSNRCSFISEVVGSQGNFVTGNFTANKDLIVGARNSLRNEAQKVGANVVFVQDQKAISAYKSNGAVNATVVGNAYRCKA